MAADKGTLSPRRILVIRRDNIGDLVLTTPLIHALRRRFPESWIGLLGNSYNAPILAGHADLDAIYCYDKAKHQPDRARLAVYLETLRTLLALRAMRIDLAILAGTGPQLQSARLVRIIGAHDVLGYVEAGRPAGVSMPVAYGDGGRLHAAEDVFRLGTVLGVEGPPGPCTLAADPEELSRFTSAVTRSALARKPLVAVHISARRPRQRWQEASFVQAMRALALQNGAGLVLLWAPGNEEDPRHPGDDNKAQRILAGLGADFPCLAWPTRTLASLTGALAACDLMLCADGGAMHVAAGLGVPVVALFGDSPPQRWRPWGVAQRVLQAASGDVTDIEVASVVEACGALLAGMRDRD